MIHAENVKYVNLVAPVSITTSAITATASCVGFDEATVIVHLATQAATSTVTLALTESDGTTYVTASELAMTTVAPSTSAPDIYAYFVDLRKRKKNLKISVTPTTAVIGSVHLMLSRAEQAPTTAAARGLAAQVVA